MLCDSSATRNIFTKLVNLHWHFDAASPTSIDSVSLSYMRIVPEMDLWNNVCRIIIISNFILIGFEYPMHRSTCRMGNDMCNLRSRSSKIRLYMYVYIPMSRLNITGGKLKFTTAICWFISRWWKNRFYKFLNFWCVISETYNMYPYTYSKHLQSFLNCCIVSVIVWICKIHNIAWIFGRIIAGIVSIARFMFNVASDRQPDILKKSACYDRIYSHQRFLSFLVV